MRRSRRRRIERPAGKDACARGGHTSSRASERQRLQPCITAEMRAEDAQRPTGPKAAPGTSQAVPFRVDVFNIGEWLVLGDVACDVGAAFVGVVVHRLIPSWEGTPRLVRPGLVSRALPSRYPVLLLSSGPFLVRTVLSLENGQCMP